MNLTDAGNTQGIIIDLVIEKGYRIRLNIDYTDKTIINYWQGAKENKTIQTRDPADLLGLVLVTENEPTGFYLENKYYKQKALEYINSAGYTIEKTNGDYKVSKPDSKFEYIPYLIVDDLPVFGWISYAEKGDNIGLNFAWPKTTEEIKAAFPIKKGDWILYANYNPKKDSSKM